MSDPAKTQEIPTEGEDKVRELFTDQFVDLEVFAEPGVVYRVGNSDGKVHLFAVPSDIPWSLALTFLRAMDRFDRAQTELARAKPQTEEALTQKADAEWRHLVESFHGVLALHDPCGCVESHDNAGVSAKELHDTFGATKLAQWFDIVRTRLHLARANADILAVIQRLLTGDKPSAEETAEGEGEGEEDPKAGGSSSSSADSVG
jgi:hypothetical protein